jgi:pimeloyl-ACP methyl ester carboxylesterase
VKANLELVSLLSGVTTPCPEHKIGIVGDAGHFPMLEVPEAVNQRIALSLAAS